MLSGLVSLSFKEVRETARSPGQVEFSDTETQSWQDVDRDLATYVEAYGTEPEKRNADGLAVAELSQSTRTAIAKTTALGDANAERREDLIAIPLVNPSTKRLNRGALEAARAAAEGARGADIPDADGVFEMAGTLLERHFDFEQEESVDEESEGADLSESVETQELHEVFPDDALSEAKVQREGHLIQNVALLGRESQNGRIYEDKAMEEAADLYEGASVYLDHPKQSEMEERRGTRSVLDLAGRIRNPRKVGDRVRGDIEVLDREPSKSLLFSLAEQMPDQAGMSHRARGEVRVNDQGTQIVESVTDVKGVELVTEPATVGGLMESLEQEPEEGDEMDYGELNLSELREQRPDLVEAIEDRIETGERLEDLEERVDELEDENEELEEERDDLQAQVDQYEREQALREQLAEAGLEREDVPKAALQGLLQTEDEDEIQEMVEDLAERVGGDEEDIEEDEDEDEGGSGSSAALPEHDVTEDLDDEETEDLQEADLGEVADRLFV